MSKNVSSDDKATPQPNNKSVGGKVENWVKIIGALCAVLTLALGIYKVGYGPESLAFKLREQELKDKRQLCTEAVGVVGALATSIDDEKVADTLKGNFLNFYNGKLKLIDNPEIVKIFDRVKSRYTPEHESKGDFAGDKPQEVQDRAYESLMNELTVDAEEIAKKCGEHTVAR